MKISGGRSFREKTTTEKYLLYQNEGPGGKLYTLYSLCNKFQLPSYHFKPIPVPLSRLEILIPTLSHNEMLVFEILVLWNYYEVLSLSSLRATKIGFKAALL